MTHTYLFREENWDAAGVFTDAAGRSQPVDGAATITHPPDLWHLDARMGTIENRYRITPFAEDRAITSWTSENAILGRLEGRFVIVDDAILSTFDSVDGRYHGVEVLLQRRHVPQPRRASRERADGFHLARRIDTHPFLRCAPPNRLTLRPSFRPFTTTPARISPCRARRGLPIRFSASSASWCSGSPPEVRPFSAPFDFPAPNEATFASPPHVARSAWPAFFFCAEQLRPGSRV